MQLANRYPNAISQQLVAYALRVITLVFGGAFLLSIGYLLRSEHLSATEVLRLVVIIVTFVLGWLIDRKHPGHTIALLLLLMAYTAALQTMMYVVRLLSEANPDLLSPALESAALTVGEVAWMPGVYIPFFIIPLYFPDGKLLSPRWRPLIWLLLVILVWSVIEVSFRPWPVPEWDIEETRAVYNGIAGSEQFFETARTVVTVLFLPVLPLTAVAVYLRYRRSEGIERIQMKWPLWAIICFLIVAVLVLLFPSLMTFDADGGYIFTLLLSLLLPASIGIAILQHRLFDINIVLSRTIVYGSLTTLIIGFYVFFVSAIGSVFHTRTDTVSGLVATGIVAVLFQPLRNYLQRGVNFLLYGERDDPIAVLTRLVHHLEVTDNPSDILPNLVQTIAVALKIPYVSILLPDEVNKMTVAARWGEPSLDHELIPINYQSKQIGFLAVATRGPRERFSADERSLLSTIATLTATTIRAVQLSTELRSSRQRIVTAREEERRRIRRDLHDGLGPQLASQTLGLEAIAQLMSTNPDKARALLESLQQQSHEAILEVRRLIYDLRPPALDDLGLAGALQQSAARYESGHIHFSFDLEEIPNNLPAAVETAIYRIAQEAMTNVVRHSKATQCTVRLYCDDSMLIAEIEDNGRGIGSSHKQGVGMQTMHERAAELNGETIIRSPNGNGTCVQIRLPLEVYRD